LLNPNIQNFPFFGPKKTHFGAGRHENKEKRLFYFGRSILLPIQIQLLDIENPENDSPKIHFTALNCRVFLLTMGLR
jgi:hypothetical protein